MKRHSVRIIGAGLIGTSIALKLIELGHEVELIDSQPTHQAIARDLVGGAALAKSPDLVIVATPPASIFALLLKEIEQTPDATFIDISSVKTNLQVEVDRFPALSERFVATHPIAGREMAGPPGAQADLFEGRAWVVITGSATSDRLAMVEQLISELGATPYRMSASDHDLLFSRVSHLPQLLSTALALSMRQLGTERDLAGSGLRDMLRLAGSDGALWSDILSENRLEVLAAIDLFCQQIERLRSAIEMESQQGIIELFELAKAEREKLSGKHGARPRDYAYLNVIIDDRPGQLAALFRECGAVEVNVEDLSLEHSPRQETGLIRLALAKGDAVKLRDHLKHLGWRAHLT